MKFSAIIQARIDSTRLHGKIFKKLNGISVLECLFEQLKYSKLLNEKIIATTTNEEDDLIENFAKKKNIKFFRGNVLDVLDRYFQCAKQYSLENIVRITADNPFIDPQIVDSVINLYTTGKFDYVNNFLKRSYPTGTEVEVFSFKVLEKAWNTATKPSEREHVTPFFYNNPALFSLGCLEYKEDLSKFHWTVNREEDLEMIRAIFKEISNRPILLNDILKVLKENPSILEITKDLNPHEGYFKSLEEDKKVEL